MPLFNRKSRANISAVEDDGRSKKIFTLTKSPLKAFAHTPNTRRLNEARCKKKGIMKFITMDESLHSKYGESKDSTDESNHNRECVRICFKDLLIREYARTVGDNPSCSSGPPVSIAWDYDPETKIVPIDQYEKLRPPRRSKLEMILPRDVRQEMLRKEWDISQAQIASAVRKNIKAKNLRRATVNNLGKAEQMEEFFESVGSKLKGGILFRKSSKKQALDLDAQYDEINKTREQKMAASYTCTIDDEPSIQPPNVIVAQESEDELDVSTLDLNSAENNDEGLEVSPSCASYGLSHSTVVSPSRTEFTISSPSSVHRMKSLAESYDNGDNPAGTDSSEEMIDA